MKHQGAIHKPFLGLDIGGTKCAVILAHVDGGIMIDDKMRFDTQTELGRDHTVSMLYETIDAMLNKHGLQPIDLRAVGVSCGGPLDSRNGIVLCPPNLPGWVNVPLTRMLTERYGVPAFLQNDANACALVEWQLGAGRGTRNMIFLTMGTGMGAGVIAEGNLICGMSDMGGEVGHLRLMEDGPVGFGKAGSFEGFTSGGGIGRQAQSWTQRLCKEGKPPKWVKDGVLDKDITTRLIAEYAKAGDADALAIFTHVGEMLGRGLSLLVDTLNPECIVIGSVFVRCEELLRPAMEAALQREAIPFSLKGLKVVPAMTGEALGDLASIMVALYALKIDPMEEAAECSPKMLYHLDRAVERYPELEKQRDNLLAVYQAMKKCFHEGGKLLIAGNGGSCADAQHIAGELMKGFYLQRPLQAVEREAVLQSTRESMPDACLKLQRALPVIVLSEHSVLNTAFANDVNPELAFAQQVVGYGRKGDVFLGISTSGNARNVLLAAQVAKARGLAVIGLTGGTGGRLKGIADEAVIVKGNCPADVQELHLPAYHALCAMLEEYFFGAGEAE
jgi:glucokinase